MRNKKLHINVVCIITIFLNFSLFSQYITTKEVQTGVILRSTIDLNGIESGFNFSNFNISLVGGIGFHPFEQSYLYPTIHAGILLYNRGDLGAPYNKKIFRSTQLEFMLNTTLNVGNFAKNSNHYKRKVPLYHFSNLIPNPLFNPFHYSVSLGSNFIFFTDKYKDSYQQVGFLNALLDRRFQFNMINDGTFFPKLFLGDGLDRYYTGGGQLSWHIDSNYLFDSFEFSFLKFTGYETIAFETANSLQLDYINFKNPNTIYYSKNRMRFNAHSSTNNFGLHLTLHNTDRDFQDFIHYKGDWSYFPDIFKTQSGRTNEIHRLGFGATYFYTKNTFK